MLIGSIASAPVRLPQRASSPAVEATPCLEQVTLGGGPAPPRVTPDASFAASLVGGPLAGPIVIGHRGASGYLPQHTLAAYELAIKQGADFIEPDLVMTKDRVLVTRHENEISLTTDVAARPEFADRKVTKEIDGKPVTGWFSEDFTLAELKSLKVTGAPHDGPEFRIATFEEVLDLVDRNGRTVGLYPETKHPTHFDQLGLSLEEPLVEALHRRGYEGAEASIFIQSFEVGNLKELNQMTDLRLVQLLDSEGCPADSSVPYSQMLTPAGLSEVATYADGIGPWKEQVRGTSLVQDAHSQGLLVDPYTFRAENEHLPAELRSADPAGLGDLESEVRSYLEAGVDGVFANHPDLAVRARDKFLKSRS